MRRRDAIVLPLAVLAGTAAQRTGAALAAAELVTEDFMLPAAEPGMQVFLHNKRPAQLSAFRPERTLLFVHGLTYASSTTFDLPLGGRSWMEHIAERGFDVWCLDLPGYGGSIKPSGMARPPGDGPPLVRKDATYAAVTAAADFIRARRSVDKDCGHGVVCRHHADGPLCCREPWSRASGCVVCARVVTARQRPGTADNSLSYCDEGRRAARLDCQRPGG